MFGSKYKELYEQQQEENSNIRPLVKAINRSMGAIEFYPSGEIITANGNFLKVVGYTLEEIRGEHHRIFCSPEYASSSEYKAFWQELNNGNFVSGKFKRLDKDGNIVWLQATYNPVFDGDNKLKKIIKYASEITDQVLHDAHHEGVINALSRSTAMIEFKPDGTVVDCNEIFAAVTGYDKSELIGKHHSLLCERKYVASQDYQDFWEKLNQGEFISGQFKRVNKSGEFFWIDASYNPLFDKEGELTGVIKIANDITAKTKKDELDRECANIVFRISNETLSVARDGGVINQAVKEMSEISQYVEQSSEHIQRLSKQSHEIDSIINTIHEIADQTNLLALNAAIEAARAGDQGRGFAVVADEVRQLASRTSQSTAEISTMINKIQEYTKLASSSMNQSMEQAKKGVDLANETSNIIDKIEAGATEVIDVISNLSDAIDGA